MSNPSPKPIHLLAQPDKHRRLKAINAVRPDKKLQVLTDEALAIALPRLEKKYAAHN